MERGVAILLGGFAIAGAACATLLLTGLVKVDVALMPGSSVGEAIKTVGATADISVKDGGAITIGGRSTTLQALPSRLDDRFRAIGADQVRGEQTIVIWADDAVRKSDLDRVVEHLKSNGWTKIQLSRAARKASDADESAARAIANRPPPSPISP